MHSRDPEHVSRYKHASRLDSKESNRLRCEYRLSGSV